MFSEKMHSNKKIFKAEFVAKGVSSYKLKEEFSLLNLTAEDITLLGFFFFFPP